jgi:hypothetical protein
MSDHAGSGRHLTGQGDDEPVGSGSPHEATESSLHAEVDQLRRAMKTRPTIDQACGMLMATFGLSPSAAWRVLVMTSQNTNTKLHRLADDLVETVHGDPLPKEVRQQLSAAVARLDGAAEEPGSAS